MKQSSLPHVVNEEEETDETPSPLGFAASTLVRANTPGSKNNSKASLIRLGQRSSRSILPQESSVERPETRKPSRDTSVAVDNEPATMHRHHFREASGTRAQKTSPRWLSTMRLFLLFLSAFLVFLVVTVMVGFYMNASLGAVSDRSFPSDFFRDNEDGSDSQSVQDSVELWAMLQGVVFADPDQARGTVNDLTKITCSVYAIVVQLTAIMIQVATQEFSTDAIHLLIRDRTLVISGIFYTFTLAYVLWLTMTVNNHYIPRGEILIGCGFVLINVLFIVPYFINLSSMLNPFRLVNRVAENGLHAASFREGTKYTEKMLLHNKRIVIWSVENIAQLGTTAMQNKKKCLVYACVEVLSRFCIMYGRCKHLWIDDWFKVPAQERETPDFFSLSNDNVQQLQDRMTWVEWKVLRQFQNMFDESLHKMKDVCYVLAVNTRKIAEAASHRHDFATWDMCTKFFNTYIRYGIVHGDIRTVHNILNQYRSVALKLLTQDLELLGVVQSRKRRYLERGGKQTFDTVSSLMEISGNYVVEEARDIVVAGETRAITMVHYLIYYASVGLEGGYSFIAETASHEVASIVECAFIQGRECHNEILDALLTMHEIASNFDDEVALWGIRRAQIKLAAIYLVHNNREHALKVQQTFIGESKARLLQLWEQLARITDRQFWEVNDRGTNMNYLSPAEKDQLKIFFAFFGIMPSPMINNSWGNTNGAHGVAPNETPRMSISVSVNDIRNSTLKMHNPDPFLSTEIDSLHSFNNHRNSSATSRDLRRESVLINKKTSTPMKPKASASHGNDTTTKGSGGSGGGGCDTITSADLQGISSKDISNNSSGGGSKMDKVSNTNTNTTPLFPLDEEN